MTEENPDILRPSTPPLSFEDIVNQHGDELMKMREDCQRNYFKQDPKLPPLPEIETLNDLCYILRDKMRKEKMKKLEQEIERLNEENMTLKMRNLYYRHMYGDHF